MRRDVKKFIFFGALEDRERFFRQAQQAGIVQFIDPSKRGAQERPPEIQRLIDANRILRTVPPVQQEDFIEMSQADEVAKRICWLFGRIADLHEEKRIVNQEISRIHIFGHFSIEDLHYLEAHGRVVQFFFSRHAHDVSEEPNLIDVGADHALHYYVSISPHKITYPGLTEMRIERSLAALEGRFKEIEQEIAREEHELKGYAKWKEALEKALITHLNEHHLLTAQEHVQLSLGNSVFAVEGWVAEHKIGALDRMARKTSVDHEEILIEPQDQVPTCLENHGLARVGEDVVHVYDTPSTNDRDPSRWVLWFFAFFFAIIVGDAGYGLVLLLTSLWLQHKFGKKAKGFPKRFLKLCLILSSSALIWGMLTNSFFGIDIAPENPLRKISLTNWLVREKVAYVLEHPDSANYKEWVAKYPPLKDEQTVDAWLQKASKTREGTIVYDLLTRFSSSVMIELAVMIGVIHLILAFCRMIDRNWAGVGWILFMVGAYLYFPSILKATSIIHFLFHVPEVAGAEVGLQLLFCGIGLAVVLSLIQNRWKGLFEIANVIQIFSDALSYLRLYALALAGGMMGATFNEIGASAGYFFGAIMIVLGHAVDLALAIMGGIIHGLRLNFLEWYRHCFEGGGKMLQPLKLIEK